MIQREVRTDVGAGRAPARRRLAVIVAAGLWFVTSVVTPGVEPVRASWSPAR